MPSPVLRVFAALLIALIAAPAAEISTSSRSGSSSAPAGPAPARVFVCAHSFMIYTARLLPEMAQAAHVPYAAAGQQMIGGSRVLQHWNLPDAQNKAKAALREGKVDVLTLSPTYQLPDEGIDNFVRLGVEKNPALRVYVQASWSPRDGHLEPGFRNEQRDAVTVAELKAMRITLRDAWLSKLEKQVRDLNASLGRQTVHIIPAGDAVLALRERVAEKRAPGLTRQSELFRDPLGHPQPPLAVLVGYCHFATIFGRSPAGLPVPPELKGWPEAEKLNTLLQELAWQAVSSYALSGVQPKVAVAGR